MAQPIRLELPPRDPKKELADRLEQAPVEYAAAILDSYELLQKLHESGAFVTLRGVLGATDKIVDDLATGANMTESIRAMRNAIILAKMLGSIDPEFLLAISESVGETLGNVRYVPAKPPGLMALLFGFTGRDHRRGLSVVMRLFQKIGHHLNADNRVSEGKVSAGH